MAVQLLSWCSAAAPEKDECVGAEGLTGCVNRA